MIAMASSREECNVNEALSDSERKTSRSGRLGSSRLEIELGSQDDACIQSRDFGSWSMLFQVLLHSLLSLSNFFSTLDASSCVLLTASSLISGRKAESRPFMHTVSAS